MKDIEKVVQQLEKKQKKVRHKSEPVPKSAGEWLKKSYDKGRGETIGGIGSEAL
jgi:hypothetical protein